MKMKQIRIKLDEKAQANKKGYYTMYKNDNKGENPNAPDFKGNGLSAWENEVESVQTVEKASAAGAVQPHVVQSRMM